jgi:two-component system sensor histidine kinase PilS (NtrC family)
VKHGAFATLRGELPLLLALALAIFVLLAGFSVLVLRATVEDLVGERRAEALRLATRLAEEAARGGEEAALGRLAAMAPPGTAVALLDESGWELEAHGFDAPADLAALGVQAPKPPSAQSRGPLDLGGKGVVVALVPWSRGAQRGFLRVDLQATTLAASVRTVALVIPVVLTLALGAALLLLFAGRALLRPYELLLAHARSTVGGADAARDEAAFLRATFDRALQELPARRAMPLEALDATLGREATSAFLLLDPAGTVLAANDVAQDLLSLATPAAGARYAQLLAGHRDLVGILDRAREIGASIPRAEARLRRGGEELTLAVVVEALRRAEGDLRGWLVLLADVTALERGAARDRLAETLAQLGELSAGVAHELRNGLATLAGYVELARRRPLEADLAEDLRESALEIAQLRRVVEDFLLFARPGTRRRDRLDLRGIAERAARDPALAGVAVECATPGAACWVEGDGQLLETAFKNLLANAAEAQRAAGSSEAVRLELGAAPGGWRVTVADRGPGLPAGEPAALFEPFRSERPGGVGLGLAISRRIVLLHGGSIELAPRPGGGALAQVTLPHGNPVTSGSAIAPRQP